MARSSSACNWWARRLGTVEHLAEVLVRGGDVWSFSVRSQSPAGATCEASSRRDSHEDVWLVPPEGGSEVQLQALGQAAGTVRIQQQAHAVVLEFVGPTWPACGAGGQIARRVVLPAGAGACQLSP